MIYERVLNMIPGTGILVVGDAFTVTWEAKITMRAINIKHDGISMSQMHTPYYQFHY
jgi:hypothetical protein